MAVLGIDGAVLVSLLKLVYKVGRPQPIPVGDVLGRRDASAAGAGAVSALTPMPADVTIEDRYAQRDDGGTVRVRTYRPDDAVDALPALVYVHGGGLIAGAVEYYDSVCATYARNVGALVLSVDYGLSPEHRYPRALDDITTALYWAHREAATLGIDPDRIGIAGDSAGGGLAAAVALKNRDERRLDPNGPRLACQLLIYPMLDYQNVPARVTTQLRSPWLLWTYDDNVTGWTAYLGDDLLAADASELRERAPYASALHAKDLADLAPAFIDVGTLDIFRPEDIAYSERVLEAGGMADLRVYNAVPHGFDRIAPNAAVAKRAWEARWTFLRERLHSLSR